MKNLLTIIFLCCLTLSANATTKCVQMPTTCSTRTGTQYGTGWAVTCAANNQTIVLKGIGVCSNLYASETTAKEEITFAEGTSEGNIYCWCKMTHPAVSLWVRYGDGYHGYYTTTDACMDNCARGCMWRTHEYSYFRSALFNNLMD